MTETSETQLAKAAVAQRGSLVVGLLMLLSLCEWWWVGVVLVNPAIATMVLVACPFFWTMGWMIRHGR